jgi:acyl dehydratase
MAVDLSYVGKSGLETEKSWTSKDALLYALAVGAGAGDPSKELEFTTENSTGITQKVLPTFACIVGGALFPDGMGLPLARLLHAEMFVELLGDIPVEGRAVSTQTVEGIYDKGSGALVIGATEVLDASTRKPLARLRQGVFVRGEGGFGGDRGPSSEWAVPDHRRPDAVVTYHPLKEQALLYRLTGDRNPLHSDPEFARRAGFPAPILHGMADFGFTGRALLHEVAGSDPSLFKSMYARFSKPVQLGEPLTVQIWKTGEGALFRTLNGNAEVVLDRGRMQLTEYLGGRGSRQGALAAGFTLRDGIGIGDSGPGPGARR